MAVPLSVPVNVKHTRGLRLAIKKLLSFEEDFNIIME
jgi:hypothetical protein